MREKIIAANMIAIARNRKGDEKRSAMLRMIMPFLSRTTGDKLAQVISNSDSDKFGKIWDGVKREITKRLKNKRKVATHLATGAAIRTFNWNDDETVINVDMYGSEKLRVTIEGVDVWRGQAPGYREMVDSTYDSEQSMESRIAELNPGKVVFETDGSIPVIDALPETPPVTPSAKVSFDFGNTGNNYEITDGEMIDLLHKVCLSLLENKDPCPLEPAVAPSFNADNTLHELRGYFTAATL